jgi:hypothetical protein
LHANEIVALEPTNSSVPALNFPDLPQVRYTVADFATGADFRVNADPRNHPEASALRAELPRRNSALWQSERTSHGQVEHR